MFSLTDELLVARALNGDRGAFAVIVETYKNVVFAVCMKVMRHHHDAEDLAQEVFLTAYQNLDTLAEPARLRAWLCKIAKYRCLNEMRRRAKRGTPEEIPEMLASDDATPEETVLFEEDREKLLTGLSALPEHLRVTVNLRCTDFPRGNGEKIKHSRGNGQKPALPRYRKIKKRGIWNEREKRSRRRFRPPRHVDGGISAPLYHFSRF